MTISAEVSIKAQRLERLDASLYGGWQRLASHPFTHAGFIGAWQQHSPLGQGAGMVLHRNAGQIVAGAPAFVWELRLDEVMGGNLSRIARGIAAVAPRYVHIPILCVGSPVADDCAICIDPALGPADRARAFDGFLSDTISTSDAMRSDLILFKDVPDTLATELHDHFERHGFTRVESMPVAVIDLPFSSFDEYLSSLDGRLRSELRRKMRQSKDINVTVVDKLDAGTSEAVDKLMAETWERRALDFSGFDRLSTGFAATLLSTMGGIARCALTWHEQQLLGCNLFLEQGPLSLAFLIGMSGEHVREFNLYFVNWLWMVRHAIESGRKRLEFGQSNYALKQRLGCRLEPSWIYVRHRQRHWNAVTRTLARRVSLPKLDPDLKHRSDG